MLERKREGTLYKEGRERFKYVNLGGASACRRRVVQLVGLVPGSVSGGEIPGLVRVRAAVLAVLMGVRREVFAATRAHVLAVALVVLVLQLVPALHLRKGHTPVSEGAFSGVLYVKNKTLRYCGYCSIIFLYRGLFYTSLYYDSEWTKNIFDVVSLKLTFKPKPSLTAHILFPFITLPFC